MPTNILDTMLETVATATTGASGTITGYAQGTFALLIVLDLALAALLNLGDVDHIKQLVKKILAYGFWMFVISNWGSLCDTVLDSLMMTGSAVGGVDATVLRHPSQLIDKGAAVGTPYYDYISDKDWVDIMSSPVTCLMALIGYLGVMLAFCVLALQIFITYIEFYLASALLLIFIPFGSFKFTSFMAEKAIGAVISYGTKLMMLGAVYGLCSNVINTLSADFTGAPEPLGVVSSVAAPFALSLLCWQAPGMAAGLINGAPSLTAGTVAGTAMAQGGAMASLGWGGTKGTAKLGMAGSRAAAGLAGALVSGGKGVDENTAPITGALKQGAGHVWDAVKNSSAGQAIQSVGTSYHSGFDAATSRAENSNSGSEESNSDNTTAAAGASQSNESNATSSSGAATTVNNASADNNSNGSSNSGTSSNSFEKAMNKAKEAVPQDAHPEGGMSVPLPKE